MVGSVLRSSLSGISTASVAIQTAADNLANSQTDGYKSSRVILADQRPQEPRSRSHITRGLGQIGSGVEVATVETDTSSGPLLLSNDPMHLAIEGDGFFVLEGFGGQHLYSRDGRFQISGNGALVSHAGMLILGLNVDNNFQLDAGRIETIKLPLGRTPSSGASLRGIDVGDAGTIRGHFSDGVARDLGQIQLAKFSNPNGLARRQQNTLAASPSSGSPYHFNAGSTRIVAGAHESSNTEMAREFVDLSRFSTMFRANQRVLETGDELLEELYHLTRY